MPYTFQENNESNCIPDRNPIFQEIQTDSSGIMKYTYNYSSLELHIHHTTLIIGFT